MAKLGQLGQQKNLRHESNLVELEPWTSMHKSITLPMITALGEKDIPGSQLIMGFAYIDQPEDKIGITTHIHPERDQWIFLFGAKNFVEFDARIAPDDPKQPTVAVDQDPAKRTVGQKLAKKAVDKKPREEA